MLSSHRAPIVTQMIWYKVGAADEPPGKTGIAHFLEHLMFQGTTKTPAGDFSRIVAAMAATTTPSPRTTTPPTSRTSRDRLETMMELEAERMTGLVLSDAVVLPERDVIIEERHARRQQSLRAAERADRRRALSQSSLPGR